MPNHTTRPQWVARAVTVALWGVGSAYLLRHELSTAAPDPVVMASVPVVWAVVLALPVLATYARMDRQWVATALIWLAAIVGSLYTLNATISRQASVRDVAVASADAIAVQRRQIEADRAQAKVELDKATARCGSGKVCHGATLQLIGLYERQIKAHDARLEKLTFAAPAAGEHRVATLIALVTGGDPQWIADLVAMLAPCLFGLTLELAAFAAAMYGWHPVRGDAAADPTVQFSADRPAPTKVQPLTVLRSAPCAPARVYRKSEAMIDLVQFTAPVQQETLAERWSVTKSMVSMWLAEWEAQGLVNRQRHGKTKTVQFRTSGNVAVHA